MHAVTLYWRGVTRLQPGYTLTADMDTHSYRAKQQSERKSYNSSAKIIYDTAACREVCRVSCIIIWRWKWRRSSQARILDLIWNGPMKNLLKPEVHILFFPKDSQTPPEMIRGLLDLNQNVPNLRTPKHRDTTRTSTAIAAWCSTNQGAVAVKERTITCDFPWTCSSIVSSVIKNTIGRYILNRFS